MSVSEQRGDLSKDILQKHLIAASLRGEDPVAFLMSRHIRFPSHIALIPDGNGRWAKEQGVSILEGHRKGAAAVEKFLHEVERIPDIKEVTLWALSVDNIAKRSPLEINNLMRLLEKMIDRLLPEFQARGNKFIHIGNPSDLPKPLQEKLQFAQQSTADNKGKIVRIGINYQGFQEELSLVNAAINSFIQTGRRLTSRHDIEALKHSSQTPSADFIIRTSGENRFSGLGVLAEHAEFYAPATYLPAMKPVDWALALSEYAFRERRYGGRPIM